MRPGGDAMSRMIESAVTLLPEPDSPTIPSVSPSFSSNDKPLTARTMPSSVANVTRRSLTESSAMLGGSINKLICHFLCAAAARPRVEGVAQSLADEIERHHRDNDE